MGAPTQFDSSAVPIGIDDLRNLLGELRAMARRLLDGESRQHSFTPTALAMTALRRVKLREQEWEQVRWENRSHFFAALATAMRHSLIDHARHRKANGRAKLVYLPPEELLTCDLAQEAETRPDVILHLEDALSILEKHDKRLSDVVHQFYFAGYTAAEMARFADRSEKTIDRDLKRARLLLRKLMEERIQN